MKLTTILVSASCLTAQAFGVSPRTFSKNVNNKAVVNNSLKNLAPASKSPLFRENAALLTRGGAVPGWTAYNEALDKNPLTAKACTSLVGWFLGDLLAQVSAIGFIMCGKLEGTKNNCHFSPIHSFIPSAFLSYLLPHHLSLCHHLNTYLSNVFNRYSS